VSPVPLLLTEANLRAMVPAITGMSAVKPIPKMERSSIFKALQD